MYTYIYINECSILGFGYIGVCVKRSSYITRAQGGGHWKVYLELSL